MNIFRSAQELAEYLSPSLGVDFLVAIDGALGSGKSTLAHDISAILCVPQIDLDSYLLETTTSYLDRVNSSKLAADLSNGQFGSIVSGVLVLDVFEKIGLDPSMHVYVKRLSANGLWNDETEIDTSQIEEIAVALGQPISASWLALEVREYHRRQRPHEVADVYFCWNELNL